MTEKETTDRQAVDKEKHRGRQHRCRETHRQKRCRKKNTGRQQPNRGKKRNNRQPSSEEKLKTYNTQRKKLIDATKAPAETHRERNGDK
jgi:hypothetical protein